MTTLQIEVPDFAAMTDDEVERHPLARTKDGRWSTQTRWLLEQLGTDRLDLNEAWAQTWTDWECPCCRRRKSEIARLTDAGVLLCQLDWHHDHLEDAASAVMRAMATAGVHGSLLVTRKRACSAARPLIARFARVLLCNDCNAADACGTGSALDTSSACRALWAGGSGRSGWAYGAGGTVCTSRTLSTGSAGGASLACNSIEFRDNIW